jgi:antitoxin component YwqK of YwqJK toxin-antitoxin module
MNINMNMNKCKYVTLVVFILLSCGKKEKKYYFENGTVSLEEIFINDSVTFVKNYSEEGNLIEEGTVKFDSIMEGQWKRYYADGQLWWEGEITNNIIQDEYKWRWEECVSNRLKGVEIDGNPKELVVGDTYRFRIISVCPKTNNFL